MTSPVTPIQLTLAAVTLLAAGCSATAPDATDPGPTFRAIPGNSVRSVHESDDEEAQALAAAYGKHASKVEAAAKGISSTDLPNFDVDHPQIGEQLSTLDGIDLFNAPREPQSDGSEPCDPRREHHCDGGDDGGADGGDDSGSDPEYPDAGTECDLPKLPRIAISNSCAGSDLPVIKDAVERAHYNVWRFDQLIEHVVSVHYDVGQAQAKEIWETGHEHQNSLSAYFGPYDIKLVETVYLTVHHVLETYLTHDGSFTLACYKYPTLGDVFNPQLLAAKLASACFWTEAYATSMYVGLPNLHPHYGYPTWELCGSFISDPYAYGEAGRGMILSHELYHWLVNDYGLLKDKFDKPACGPNGECTYQEEIVELATEFPSLGGRNIHGYAEFGLALSNLYYLNNCDEGFCFAEGLCPPPDDDGPSGAPPIPEDCEDVELGSCEWGGCAPVNHAASLGEKLDPYSAAHPDGDFSKDTFCYGADLVCNRIADEGRCVPCGPGQMLGCPCDTQDQCDGDGSDLSCFGSHEAGWKGSTGTCWPSTDGPPVFQCAEGCEGRTDYLGNTDYYCYHDTNVVSEAVCLHTDCSEPDAFCAVDDIATVCDGSSCVAECVVDDDCDDGYGWPVGTTCVSGECLPPFGP